MPHHQFHLGAAYSMFAAAIVHCYFSVLGTGRLVPRTVCRDKVLRIRVLVETKIEEKKCEQKNKKILDHERQHGGHRQQQQQQISMSNIAYFRMLYAGAFFSLHSITAGRRIDSVFRKFARFEYCGFFVTLFFLLLSCRCVVTERVARMCARPVRHNIQNNCHLNHDRKIPIYIYPIRSSAIINILSI